MMSIKIIIYFGCLKCARHCKKIFILIVSFVRRRFCKFSQLRLIPVLHSLQAAQVHPSGVSPQALAINLSCLALEFPCCTLGSPLEHSFTPNWEHLMPSGSTLDQWGTDVNG